MQQLLENHPMILMEAAIVEQLRRSDEIELHDRLVNAPLVYEETGRRAMGELYQGYIDIAIEAGLPILMCTPTWRANRERVFESTFSQAINIDVSHFMQQLRAANGDNQGMIKIGGMIGCKNDCYLPEQGLSATEAEQFHDWQIDQLVQGGVDFLIAETLPNIGEATGIARAMEKTDLPYVISFVISRDGHVLDGTPLSDAIDVIDTSTDRKPIGFMVNCAYPSFLCVEQQPGKLFDRLIGYLANASSLDHCDLDNAGQLHVEPVSEWGDLMLELNRTYGVKVLGGCCGTGCDHLRYLFGRPYPQPVT
jgi:S-methylmethionine-dependent homocysteine/selenocysteine methylase